MKKIIFILIVKVCFAQWFLLDSISTSVRCPAASFLAVEFDEQGESLVVYVPSDSLTGLAKLAVEKAPYWLRFDLTDNLNRLDSILQDYYSQMILDAEHPFIDEIAFQVAHIPYNILNQPVFYPDMIIENAQSVYEADSLIPYALIIDYGVGGIDSNYYSTVSYRTLDQYGDTIEIEYVKEYYYWYILHPKISREFCSYINPNTGDPASPPTGNFWRDYLFNHADSGYPYLKDYLMDSQILWGGLHNDTTDANGAIARINNWMRQVMTFQSPGIRKFQPVQIYHEHRGTCTEWSILTAAAARASFIPLVRTSAYGNNHHWNEFFERRWVQWEPVNKMIDNYTYDPNWWELAAAIDWRGDGYTWQVTDRYTPFCSLTVQVEDSLQNPVDGARVAVRGGPQPVAWYCAIDYTNSSGECLFLLGDLLNYDVQVSSSVGATPFTRVITNSQPGVHYYWTEQLNGGVPILAVLDDTLPINPLQKYKVEFNLSVPSEVIYGSNPDDTSFFALSDTTGLLEFFICNSTNFTEFLSDSQFHAFLISKDIAELDSNFIFPWHDSWYVVISNKEKISNTQEIFLEVALYKNPAYVTETKGFVIGTPLLLIQPNPFRDRVDIIYQPALFQEMKTEILKGVDSNRKTMISMEIHDVSGRLVKDFALTSLASSVALPGHVVAGEADSGQQSTISWDCRDDGGRELPAGVYFLTYSIGTVGDKAHYKETRKLILLR